MVVFTKEELKELKESLPKAQVIIEALIKSDLVQIKEVKKAQKNK